MAESLKANMELKGSAMTQSSVEMERLEHSLNRATNSSAFTPIGLSLSESLRNGA